MNRSLEAHSLQGRDYTTGVHSADAGLGLRSYHGVMTCNVSSAPKSLQTIFNELVPTNCRVQNREDASKPLGVLVGTGVGGPAGHSNFVRVRLTDPADPFFLYQLELLEDDYGRFKKEHQLHVDFAEFGNVLAGMLQDVREQNAAASGSDARGVALTTAVDRKLYFEVGANATGQLFVQELTRFKTTNVLELHLNREGDVGQKKYLAEQFEHFQLSYLDSEMCRKDEAIALERTIQDLRRSLLRVENERDELSEKVRLDTSELEARHQKLMLEKQELQASEARALRQAADDERHQLQKKLDTLQQLHREVVSAKDIEISTLSARVAQLETVEVTLKGQLNLKTATLDTQLQEVAQLQAQVRQLQEHRNGAQRMLSETGLQTVQLTERLAAAERNTHERSEETRVLRQQAHNDAETIRVLTDQLKDRNAKVAESEADLKKAHHIIANQLQSAKQHKERYAGLVQQLQDARYVLEQQQQKNKEHEQNASRSTEEQRKLQESIAALREQLQQLLDANTKLESDLKQAQNAVVHVQRHGAYSLNRHIASVSGVSGMAPGADIYRQFAATTHMTSSSSAQPATNSFSTTSYTDPAGASAVGTRGVFPSQPITSGTGATPLAGSALHTFNRVPHQSVPQKPIATSDAPSSYF